MDMTSESLCSTIFRQSADEADRFQADAHDLADEADDVFFVVETVGVGADAAAFVPS